MSRRHPNQMPCGKSHNSQRLRPHPMTAQSSLCTALWKRQDIQERSCQRQVSEQVHPLSPVSADQSRRENDPYHRMPSEEEPESAALSSSVLFSSLPPRMASLPSLRHLLQPSHH